MKLVKKYSELYHTQDVIKRTGQMGFCLWKSEFLPIMWRMALGTDPSPVQLVPLKMSSG
jgi:hypothetical protein